MNQRSHTNLKARWLEALRSGKYKQARGRLRDESGAMCCLGVLCDLVDPAGWHREEEFEADGEPSADGKAWAWKGDHRYPPYALLQKVGFTERAPLTARNDGVGDLRPHSFAELADFIEAHKSDESITEGK